MKDSITAPETEVMEIISETQDGKMKRTDDRFTQFLLNCIEHNTKRNGSTDINDLISDLEYGVSEFTKALKAVKNHFVS